MATRDFGALFEFVAYLTSSRAPSTSTLTSQGSSRSFNLIEHKVQLAEVISTRHSIRSEPRTDLCHGIRVSTTWPIVHPADLQVKCFGCLVRQQTP